MEPKPRPTREELRAALHELWPSLPFGTAMTVDEGLTVLERIQADEAEAAALTAKVKKARRAKR